MVTYGSVQYDNDEKEKGVAFIDQNHVDKGLPTSQLLQKWSLETALLFQIELFGL